MNRRELFVAGGAGVVGLLFPQKVASGRPVRILEGLTDLGMAQKIAEFPQSSESAILPDYMVAMQSSGCELRDDNNVGWCRSSWTVEGTVIYGALVDNESLVRARSANPSTDGKWQKFFNMDVKDLSVIRFRQSNPIPSNIYNMMTEYLRLTVDGGSGWFTLSEGVNDEQA